MMLLLNDNPHTYSFAVTGMKVKPRNFSTREQATQHMYKVMNKHNLSIKKIYDDGPFKTFIMNSGVRIYIHQM